MNLVKRILKEDKADLARKIAALSNTSGRTPEEAATFKAHAEKLKTKLGTQVKEDPFDKKFKDFLNRKKTMNPKEHKFHPLSIFKDSNAANFCYHCGKPKSEHNEVD